MKRIFRFFTIKYWKEYIRLRHILKCIENAKINFLLDRSENIYNIDKGMCYYLSIELFGRYENFDKIKDVIPVFTTSFFHIDSSLKYAYWWEKRDIQSRIDAFNKLINHYKKLIKEL